MKKRVLLIPASLMILSSCTPSPDLQNKYANMEDCLKDNNPQEIQQALCREEKVKMTQEECEKLNSIEKLSKKYACTEQDENGQKVVLGPAYPQEYYEKTSTHSSGGGMGFLMGYWMGRSLSSGVYHRSSSSSFTHSGFKSAGSSRSMGISRGGFGRSGRGFSMGG